MVVEPEAAPCSRSLLTGSSDNVHHRDEQQASTEVERADVCPLPGHCIVRPTADDAHAGQAQEEIRMTSAHGRLGRWLETTKKRYAHKKSKLCGSVITLW